MLIKLGGKKNKKTPFFLRHEKAAQLSFPPLLFLIPNRVYFTLPHIFTFQYAVRFVLMMCSCTIAFVRAVGISTMGKLSRSAQRAQILLTCTGALHSTFTTNQPTKNGRDK